MADASTFGRYLIGAGIVVVLLSAITSASCGGLSGDDGPRVQSWGEPKTAGDPGDKDRILALQDKGGTFSPFACFKSGDDDICDYDREMYQRVEEADTVHWVDCNFGQHGLGGFVSLVTIEMDDESWHTVYTFDKNVC